MNSLRKNKFWAIMGIVSAVISLGGVPDDLATWHNVVGETLITLNSPLSRMAFLAVMLVCISFVFIAPPAMWSRAWKYAKCRREVEDMSFICPDHSHWKIETNGETLDINRTEVGSGDLTAISSRSGVKLTYATKCCDRSASILVFDGAISAVVSFDAFNALAMGLFTAEVSTTQPEGTSSPTIRYSFYRAENEPKIVKVRGRTHEWNVQISPIDSADGRYVFLLDFAKLFQSTMGGSSARFAGVSKISISSGRVLIRRLALYGRSSGLHRLWLTMKFIGRRCFKHQPAADCLP